MPLFLPVGEFVGKLVESNVFSQHVFSLPYLNSFMTIFELKDVMIDSVLKNRIKWLNMTFLQCCCHL